MLWSNLQNLVSNQISKILVALGAASPIALVLQLGFSFDHIYFVYVGWSLLFVSYIAFQILCPQLISQNQSRQSFLDCQAIRAEQGKIDTQFEYKFLECEKAKKKVEKLDIAPKEFLNDNWETIKIEFPSSYDFYLSSCKYDFFDSSRTTSRWAISISIGIAFLMMQYPTGSAILNILGIRND